MPPSPVRLAAFVVVVFAESSNHHPPTGAPDLAGLAGKCLLQRSSDSGGPAASRSFSDAQHGCIGTYLQKVEALAPRSASHLRQRRWGGRSRQRHGNSLLQAPTAAPPVLGAGFSSTGTMSLALFMKQIGFKPHHPKHKSHEWPDAFWAQIVSAGSHGSLETCNNILNDLDFAQAFSAGFDSILGAPAAHYFLDFYAVSPSSKVILTTRPTEDWILASSHGRIEDLAVPLQSPCGATHADVDLKVAAQLWEAHHDLVRCVVPRQNLLEFSLSDGAMVDSARIAQFLGRTLEWPIPFPRIGESQEFGAAPGESTTLPKKLAVCITGQLGRLELDSKIRNIIRPAMKAGMEVRVALVMDPRAETVYVHRPLGTLFTQILETGANQSYKVVDGPFKNLWDAANAMPHGVSVIFDPFAPEGFQVDDRYLPYQMYDKHNNYTEAYARTRVKSHTRQWQALDRCWDQLGQFGFEDMDYLLRIRDDDYILNSFVPSGPAKRGLRVPPCMTCHGMNDRLAMAVGSDAARLYLSSPLDKMRYHFGDVLATHRARTDETLNPESVQLDVALLNNLSVDPLDADSLSFATARYVSDGSQLFTCLPSYQRECSANATWDRLMARSFLVKAEQSWDAITWHVNGTQMQCFT
eukprot:TRINITY_DN8226_c0_g1_i1.p1 TRINITY_DN8226_c0_g1~~TRINITY_DN8226_c0_g1_i1.p1  ORF type:complete len:638 (+),score=99.13 TRINITY_DN8226_c0_g1_i1:115-2028(+)